MRLQQTLFLLFSLFTTLYALALPAPFDTWEESAKELFKRKGGGGGGGRGGGGSSSSGSGSSGSGSSGSGSSGSGSSGGSSRGGSGSSGSSISGGSTRGGSGSPRGYGNGGYYGGGASVPYTAGSTHRGIAPYVAGGAAVGLLGGAWLYGNPYVYPWGGYYHWHNNTNNQNETGPVDCLSQQKSVCGCEPNNSTDYLDAVANNQSIASRAANGTLYINGTLDDGTTAPGGDSAAAGLQSNMMSVPGLLMLVAGVVVAVYY